MKKIINTILIFGIFCSITYASGHNEKNYRSFFTESAAEISNRLSVGTKIAVVPEVSGTIGDISVTEMTQAILAIKSLNLVNRNYDDFGILFYEADFQLSGNVPDESAVRLGHFLETDVIVITSYKILDRNINVQIRVISVKNGQIYYSRSKKMKFRTFLKL